MWKTLSGIKYSLEDYLKKYGTEERELFIGTDSIQTRGKTKFTSVVVSLNPGKGGIALTKSWKEEKIIQLRERLMKETWYSIDLSCKVTELVKENIPVIIHLDINKDKNFLSGNYKSELAGYVASMGFGYKLKPESWASSVVADKVCHK